MSVPAGIRKDLSLGKGQRLVWEKVGERELRVTVLRELEAKGAVAMLGFAKRFRASRRTREWMDELRASKS